MNDPFTIWMSRCDEAIADIGEFSSTADIPDWDWYDAYDEGLTPRQAVRKAMKAAEVY